MNQVTKIIQPPGLPIHAPTAAENLQMRYSSFQQLQTHSSFLYIPMGTDNQPAKTRYRTKFNPKHLT